MEDTREEYQRDAEGQAEEAYWRDLWRFCVDVVARRSCCQHGAGHEHMDAYFGQMQCPASLIEDRLLDVINDVPDLGVLIRKVDPDMMAFAESRMTTAQRYRF